ncbi:MAG: terminase gpA endonuclease subunit [Planctomycetota bacterium]
MDPVEWAATRRRLVRPYSNKPGAWSWDKVPFLVAIAMAFVDPSVRKIVLQKSTQVGGTELLYNLLGWAMDVQGSSNLLVVPRDDDLKPMSKRVDESVFEPVESIQKKKSGRKRDWHFDSMKLLNGAWCRMVGARSPAALASFAHQNVFGDEAGKWGRFNKEEGPPFQLAEERNRTYLEKARAMLVSTPTHAGNLITVEFEKGDQQRYHVPCPHCGKFQVLQWKAIKFNDCRDANEMRSQQRATYECLVDCPDGETDDVKKSWVPGCGKEIPDSAKPEMLRRGLWVPKGGRIEDGQVVSDQPPSSVRSYHLWAAYSPWLTWSDIAAKFLEAHNSGDPSELQNFTNSWLGECWEERVGAIDDDEIRNCIADYERNSVPRPVRLITAGVDVQADRMWYVIRGWGSRNRSWLIRSGYVIDWPALVKLLFQGGYGLNETPVSNVFIDSQHRTDEVLEFSRRYQTAVPIVGGKATMPGDFSLTTIDRSPVTGAPYPRGIKRWVVNVNRMKTAMHQAITYGPKHNAPRRFFVHRDPGSDYLYQMASEQLVKDHYGREQTLVYFWKPRPGRLQNHLWDCEVYAWAAAKHMHAQLLPDDGTEEQDPEGLGTTSSVVRPGVDFQWQDPN